MKKNICLALVISLMSICMIACGKQPVAEPSVTEEPSPSPSPAPEFSDEIQRSLTQLGNAVRLQKFWEKLEKGEDVTVACIGGSITEGYKVNKSECYASLLKQYCTEKSNGSKVKLINAGISGTPSNLGLMRLDNDVLQHKPDLVVVEFAVNDAQDVITKMMYDSLVRTCLSSESAPAVVILLTVTRDGYSCESYMTSVGKAYDLPVINVKSAIWPEIQAGNMKYDDYSADETHPNKEGHKRILSYFDYMFYSAKTAKAGSEPDYSSVYAFSPNFTGMKMYLAETLDPDFMGGFKASASGIGSFGEGWGWIKNSEDGGMRFTMTGKDLFIAYVSNNKATFGALEVYIDGELKKTINSNDKNGWGGAAYATILNDAEAAEHKVELKMAADSVDKSFQIVCLATTGEIDGGHLTPPEEIPSVERAILSKGNDYRLSQLFERAERGEKLTIGFIGGSITMGSGASTANKCYAKLVYDWFVKTFPKSEFTFVNAGIGATTSQFACARLESDLLSYKPDFVITEFSVNDDSSAEFQDSYESLLRRILQAENGQGKSEIALVVLNMVQYDSGINAQTIHNQVAKYYELPIISMKESLYKDIVLGKLTAKDVSADNLHPNDRGHAFAAEIVTNYLDKIKAKTSHDEAKELPEKTLTKCNFITAERLNNKNLEPVLQGFTVDTSKQNGITDIFKNGFEGKNAGDSISFKASFKDLFVQFRRSNTMGAPKAEVFIDGEKLNTELDGNFENGWGNWLYLQKLVSGEECKEHTVEIRIKETGTKQGFYVTSFIVTK